MNRWCDKTELAARRFIGWLGLASSKFYHWRQRYGRVNAHNASVPRDHWLEDWERQAILDFERQYPLEGYRRLTFMMLDRDVVAASPASVYRVLKAAGRLSRWNGRPSKKGTGFAQPLQAHEHWHIDVSHINVCGAFYYLCSVLDGCSRFIVHWDLRASMTERDVEIILQAACEKFPGVTPRIISDNGPQFIARDFKAFIRLCGMTHVKTSPYYPQSNGKLERYHRSLKSECIRPGTPLSWEDARQIVSCFVEHYNGTRLHSAIGYVTPQDKLCRREAGIFAARDAKLEAARERRRLARARAEKSACTERRDLVRCAMDWAEDRATLGSDPSADPGAETDGRGGPPAGRPAMAIRIGTKAINPGWCVGDGLPRAASPERRLSNSR